MPWNLQPSPYRWTSGDVFIQTPSSPALSENISLQRLEHFGGRHEVNVIDAEAFTTIFQPVGTRLRVRALVRERGELVEKIREGFADPSGVATPIIAPTPLEEEEPLDSTQTTNEDPGTPQPSGEEQFYQEPATVAPPSEPYQEIPPEQPANSNPPPTYQAPSGDTGTYTEPEPQSEIPPSMPSDYYGLGQPGEESPYTGV